MTVKFAALRRALVSGASAAGLMAASSSAFAAVDVTFNGDTSGQPAFNRPLIDFSGSTGINVPFAQMPFRVDTANLTIGTILGTNADTVLYFYSPSFNPAAATLNGLAANDDFGGTLSLLSAIPVTSGTQYVSVVTGFSPLSLGTFGLQYQSAAANNFYLTNALVGFDGATTITAGTLHTGVGALNGALGSGAVSIGGAGTLNLYSSVNNTVANAISGGGVLRKSGAGVTTITGAISHTGGTFVDSGTLLRNGAMPGNVTVNSGGTMAGNFNIAGTLTGVGANANVSVGNSPGSATAGGLAGTTVQNVEVQLNNAGAPVNGTTHDFLNVTGNVTGTHTVNIIPFAPSASPTATTGLGIELFRVGGTVAASAFSLAGPVVQGGFEYLLRYRPDYAGTVDGFFLVSTPQQELSLNAAMLGAGRETLKACARDKHFNPDLGKSKGRVWVGAQYGSFEADESTGTAYDGDYHCIGGGIDAAVDEHVQIGLAGGIANTGAHVRLAMGNARIEGETAIVEARAAYVSGQTYVKGSLGYASTDWDIQKTPGRGFAAATVDGLIGSLEAGRAFRFDDPMMLTLSAALNYDGTECGAGCLVPGAAEDTTDWSGKLSAAMAFNLDNPVFQPTVRVGLGGDFGEGQSAGLGNAVATSDIGIVYDAGLAFSSRVTSDMTVFGDASVARNFDGDYDRYQISAGVKIVW